MFRLIARLTTNRPLLVVLAMAIVMAVALSFSAGLSDRLSSTGFTTRGAESEKALDQLAKATGADADAQVVALVDFNKPIDSKRGRRLVATVTKKLKAEPNMKFVNSPFDDGGVDKSLIANDGKAAVVIGNLRNGLGDGGGAADRLQNAFANLDHVTLGGSEMAKNKVSATIRNDLKRAELMAFPLILLIALFVFRGLIAALLPVLIGGITIPVSFALIRMFDNITDLSVFALNLTTGMGLGLAIDYSLLMVTRFREELATGLDKREAVRRTVGTAGRTVAYSAMTVAGATSALAIFPLKFLYSMGIGGATVALVSASVALILLPALLMLLGDKIDRFGIPRRSAEHSIALWRRLATHVMVHPWPVIATTTTVLVLLALPVGGIRFTSVDASVLKGGAGPRVVDQAVKNDFPRNDANSSLWVVVASDRYDAVKVSRDAKRVHRRATRVKRDSAAVKRDAKKLRLAMLAPGANPAVLQRRAAHVKRETAKVKRTARRVARQSARVKRSADRLNRYEQRIKRYAKRVAQVANVEQTGKLEVSGKHTWQFDVYTRDSRYAQRTQDAVKNIRTLDPPGRRWVGGSSASFVDQRASIMQRVGLALVLIGVITFIALFLLTGSVVLPIKTFIMNLVTLSATFGILVTIFQNNHLEGLLHYEGQGALEMTQPVLLFAIAFGLATDYGVFLLSRIKELHESGQDNTSAVVNGVSRTGRVISSAAFLFCVAILAFSTSDIVFVKELGIGTALAVAIDASIVRAMLVPALMKVLGDYNWWAPKPLRWLHDRIGLSEGPSDPAMAGATFAGSATIDPVNGFDGRQHMAPPMLAAMQSPARSAVVNVPPDPAPVRPAPLTSVPAASEAIENGGAKPVGAGVDVAAAVVGNGGSSDLAGVAKVADVAGVADVARVADVAGGSNGVGVVADVAGGSNGVGVVADVADVAGVADVADAADVAGKTVGDVAPDVSANGRGAHTAVDDDEQRVYNLRIEMSPGMADQLDAAGRVARQAVWVAIAIPAFVFVANRMRER